MNRKQPPAAPAVSDRPAADALASDHTGAATDALVYDAARRRFVLTLPALALLTACGGGSTATRPAPAPAPPAPAPAPPPPPPAPPPPAPAPPPPPAPAPPPAPPGTVGFIDLSLGLRDYGLSLVPYSKLAKPTKGQTVIDPDFGTKITRITDCLSDFNALVAVPAYPTAMAWNSDESFFILYVTSANAGGKQGWALYDGKSYVFIRFLDINPADIEQFYWDHDDPQTLRYIDNHSIGSATLADLTAINVVTGVKTIVYSFLPNNLPSGWPITGPVRCGYPFALGINANGDRIWGLGAGGVPNVNGELGLNVFGFNETTKQMIFYDPAVVPQLQARGSTPFPMVSGNGFIWNAAVGLNSTPTTQSAVLDINGKLLRYIDFDTNEHCDTAQDLQGQDLLVGSQFSRNTGGNGNCIVANLATGAIQNFVGESSNPVYGYPVTGSLSGSTAWKNPSWAVTGMTGNVYGTNNNGPTPNPSTLLDQEVMITNLNTGATYRIAHHRSTGNYSNSPDSNYWAQTNVTFSTRGTRILFQSDWGDGDPGNPVISGNAATDTYLIELPSYVP